MLSNFQPGLVYTFRLDPDLVAGRCEGGILHTGQKVVQVVPGARLLPVPALRVIPNTTPDLPEVARMFT